MEQRPEIVCELTVAGVDMETLEPKHSLTLLYVRCADIYISLWRQSLSVVFRSSKKALTWEKDCIRFSKPHVSSVTRFRYSVIISKIELTSCFTCMSIFKWMFSSNSFLTLDIPSESDWFLWSSFSLLWASWSGVLPLLSSVVRAVPALKENNWAASLIWVGWWW